MSLTSTAQTLVNQRVSDLMNQNYVISGDAFLEEFDNGDLTLRLSSDFSTPAGPDVRIFLSNSLSVAGAQEIVNLSSISHFNGAIEFDVPSNVAIDDYDFIVFFCFAFNQLWASGEFGATTGGSGPTCNTSSIFNPSGASFVDICPSDGTSDIIPFQNTLGLPGGSEYAYLITDENENLQEVVLADQYDFEGSVNNNQRVYGMHYSGVLSPMIGADRSLTTADGCFEHSSSSLFILVAKDACATCDVSEVTLSDGSDAVSICSNDGIADQITFDNSLGLSAGSEYAYLITDENEILEDVFFPNTFDFEGTSSSTQRVYGINYDGSLNAVIGSNRLMTDATGCFEHSNATDFVTVTKDACFNCSSSTVNNASGANLIDLCPTDNSSDVITLENSLGISAGSNYVYLLTNANEILQEVIMADQYDFEGSNTSEQRVYGMHYDGTLNINIGANRIFTSATNCFEHSSNTDFITVTKNACFVCESNTVSNAGGANTLDICPTDNESDVVQLQNSLGLSAGTNYVYLLTDANEILQEVISADQYDFEGSTLNEQRVYGMHFDGTLSPAIGSDRMATTASACFEHSGSTDFITVTKNACFVCNSSDVSNASGANTLDICPTDNGSDVVQLQNSLGLAAGTNYVYLLTDANEILQEVISVDQYDFEGSTLIEQRVYGMHFDGTLNPAIGSDRMSTTATGCFEHSGASNFITVTKNACFVCNSSDVSNAGGANTLDICPTDNGSDVVQLQNSLGLSAGTNYVYLLTDANEILQEVVSVNQYDFEGSTLSEQRLYGMHFDGTLNPVIGSNRIMTTASGCFEHSTSTNFITITKNACFVCESNSVSNTNGSNSIDLCPSDNVGDVISFSNSLGLNAGSNYVYLLTDANEVLQEVIMADQYDFESSSMNEQRVYGMHFDGALNIAIGFNRFSTTASGCFEHSNASDFIQVTKNACFVCEASSVNNVGGSNSINICPSDNVNDIVNLSNTLGLNAGANYVYLLTDENEILQEVISTDQFNFEGTTTTTQRIYGLHFDGTLNAVIGAERFATSATGCFRHSNDQDFISVAKNACFDCNTSTVSNGNGTNALDICPTDGDTDIVTLVNSLGLSAGSEYVYLLTDDNQILEEVIMTDQYDFESSSSANQRVYGMHYDGALNAVLGANRLMTSASGCFEHSDNATFLSVSKNACITCEANSVSSANGQRNFDICPSDNNSDLLSLENSLGLNAGSNYVYLLTDANEILQEVINADSYEFEGSNTATQRVYGMHFDGTLSIALGQNRTGTTASRCFEHSSANDFIEITKTACFDCLDNSVANTTGSGNLDICPIDGDSDIVSLENSLGLPAGANYVYLLTDDNEVLQEVISVDQYNFEGTNLSVQRIYGLHFDGALNVAVGFNRTATTASGCFRHSSATDFIRVSKNACFDCNTNTVSNANGSNAINICPSDGVADVISLENSLGLAAGDNYAYLLTDENEILLEIVSADQYDFEGSASTTQRIYGIHFDGILSPAIGANRMNTTADGCFEHSSGSDFISVGKDACFDCNASTVSSSLGNNINICPTDNESDLVPLQNSLGLTPGDNYVYLLTDENEILLEVITADNYDFEGSSLNTERIYGIHFDGALNAVLGANRMQTSASDCFEHSSVTDFISVSKSACFDCNASTVSSANGNEIDICPSDNEIDIIPLQNSLGLVPGENYVYLLTDENEILLEVISEDSYNFEGSSLNTQRIYGMHFEGTLDAVLGANRMQTSANECFEHSSATDFISISKNACFECLQTSLVFGDGSDNIDICPTDNEEDILTFANSLNIVPGDHFVYLLTDENEILQEVIVDNQFDFEGTSLSTQRVYGLHFDGILDAEIGSNRLATTASSCFEHSPTDGFITITKTACFTCSESSVQLADGSSEIDICPDDSNDDIVNFTNSLGLNAGSNYVYLLTDNNQILLEVINASTFDFEGSGNNAQRVYGMHFDGTISPSIGSIRTATSASGCFAHSNDSDFISITKEACETEIECELSFTATTDWASTVDICPNDGESDIIPLMNNLFIAPGENYAYLLTDAGGILQEVILTEDYDFEGSSIAEQRIYGIHYDGTLFPALGEDRMQTTASGCFEHSGENIFLTITKNACPPSNFVCETSLTATTDWATEADICPNDGEADWVELRNTLSVPAGDNYAYLITDESNILQSVVFDTIYNFEGSGLATQRVYGVHFDGTLLPAIGEDRVNTTATGCFEHSGDNLFLTITKGACAPSNFVCETSLTATTDWATNVEVCPSDGEADWIELRNTLFIPAGDNYAYLITDVNNVLQSVVFDTLYNFEGSGAATQLVYGIHFDGSLIPAIGENRLSTTATGCFEHSGDNLFLTVTKADCGGEFDCQESLTATTAWVTNVDVCANDGEADWVLLQNNISTPPGDNYVFLLTDENEILQEVIFDSLYNFENTGLEEARVYGMSYAGSLTARIGEDRKSTGASDCFIHSGDNLFITINKTAACDPTSTQDPELLNSISVFPNPSSGLVHIDLNNAQVEFSAVTLFDIHGKRVMDLTNQNQFYMDTAGVYILQFDSDAGVVSKRVVVQK